MTDFSIDKSLLAPPPHDGDVTASLFGTPPLELFVGADTGSDEVVGQAQEEMPQYIQDLFARSGIPRNLGPGQGLEWVNACKTSMVFTSAEVLVEDCGNWFELSMLYQTGRQVRLRMNRYADIMAIEDSAGIDSSDPGSIAAARITLEFHKAAASLMLKH